MADIIEVFATGLTVLVVVFIALVLFTGINTSFLTEAFDATVRVLVFVFVIAVFATIFMNLLGGR